MEKASYNFNIKYLKLLSKKYNNIRSVCEQIINLTAILNLPKGTELFLSDIHGEYDAFLHTLNNCASVIRNKIDNIFFYRLSENERKTLATLIYYPEEKLSIVKKRETNLNEWYILTLYRLIQVCREVSTKYTRSKVRKSIPNEFAYIIDEVLHSQGEPADKERYYRQIISSIIETGMADEFIIAISNLIKRLAIDHLHIVGDVYDRGVAPDKVMEYLKTHHSLDIQWGNHDILWMGATCGNTACITNLIRICARYDNLDILEDSYGINLRPITTFATKTYSGENNKKFEPKSMGINKYGVGDKAVLAQVQKAMAVIQFKLEGELIKKHPEYKMEDRLLLDKMDLKRGTIIIDGVEYQLNDKVFPTITLDNPYKLTSEEEEIVSRVRESFINSEKLNDHISFMYAKGSMYSVYNSNLLLHACIPMTDEGIFAKLEIDGKVLSGKTLMDYFDKIARTAYLEKKDTANKKDAVDAMWYLWCGPQSPLFGKDKMATFERYFIDDKNLHKENKNSYFKLVDKEEICDKILIEFGLEIEDSHIISGHVPIKSKDGESPVRANGKYLFIDGGMSRSYRKETGIAGYNLTYNSYGLLLSANQSFDSREDAINNDVDTVCNIVVKENVSCRKLVLDTDEGKVLNEEIEDLKMLLEAYRQGIIAETVLEGRV